MEINCRAGSLQSCDHKVFVTVEEKATIITETETETENCSPLSPPEAQSPADNAEREPSSDTDGFTDQPEAETILDGEDSDSAFAAHSRALEEILSELPPSVWDTEVEVRGKTPREGEAGGDADEVLSLASWTCDAQISEGAVPEFTGGGSTTGYGVIPIEDLEEIDDDSPSRLEWLRQRRKGVTNKHIDKMMAMVGLEDIKSHFLKIKARVETARRQGVDLSKERFNAAFTGNPGTGKTTVAKLYARFLISIKAIPGKSLTETSTSDIVYVRDIKGTAADFRTVRGSGGGVFFVDEAHQLVDNPADLEHLLGQIEKCQGKVVFIFSGYSDKMEQFLSYDPGVPSRIPHIVKFTDYSDEDLLRILVRLISARFHNKMQLEGGIDGLYARILVRRLGRGRGKKGFGNARALENAFSKVCERQADRLRREYIDGKKPDEFLLTKEDLIGPKPLDTLSKSKAWWRLQNLIGLDDIKESIRASFHRVHVNYQRELEEKQPIQVSLNRVFLGPPGTGKTTVGKLYGQILADMGLLSSSEVVIKNPSDFIGEYIGWSEKATKSILASAMGKVLIIDEAHMLYPGKRSGDNSGPDSYRTAIIDTLVAEIQNIPGEDRCVILMGYAEPMRDMFHHCNPGLARRFPLENAFHFKDFDNDQLAQILDNKLKKQDLTTNNLARQVASQMLSLARDRPNFGNGGEVENILSRAKAAQQKRILANPPAKPLQEITLEPEDFDADYDRALRAGKNCEELFKDVIGCEDVIAQLRGYQQIADGMRMHGIDPRPHIPFNFIFKGPPGTGKTTTARKIGQIFYDMGFLSSPDVVECSVTDMVAETVGSTGPKVIELLERALGKVLFIDEAYRLGQGGTFSMDAVNELVDCVTKTQFESKIIIILAGYEEDMNDLLYANRGLSSRFATEVVFHHMSPEHCLVLLQQYIGRLGIRMPDLDGTPLGGERKTVVVQLFASLTATASWGNGRDVETLAKRVIGHVFKACASDSTKPGGGGGLAISFQELVPIMNHMLKERRKRGAGPGPDF